jgi:RES domain-containing protein
MPSGFRIAKARHARDAFDGEGAHRYGGRWNGPGTPLLYTSASRALAVLELLVHLQASELLATYVLIEATFDAALVERLEPVRLPRNRRAFPSRVGLQEIGDRWTAERRSAVLEVLSAVVPAESNFLLNPLHRDFAKIAVGGSNRFEFDSRLGPRS